MNDSERPFGAVPDADDLERLATDLGLGLTRAELAEYAPLVRRRLDAYSRLDELEPAPPPWRPRPRDPGSPPAGRADPRDGWSWRCSLRYSGAGPLAGRRVAVQDDIAVAGLPMRLGSPLLSGFAPGEDATVVTRMLEAGAEIVGKTAAADDGVGGTAGPGSSGRAGPGDLNGLESLNGHGGLTGGCGATGCGVPDDHGVPRSAAGPDAGRGGAPGAVPRPRNPHDPARLAGGPSGGSAVVLATGQADLAIGTDHGGELRVPAAWCGCVAHKPTYGLVPLTGAFPFERTLDHLGPMARAVADCALLLEVLAGADGLDPRQQVDLGMRGYRRYLDADARGTRIAVLREGFDIPGVSEPDVDAAVLDALDGLSRAGARVEEVSVPLHRDGPAIWSAVAHQGMTDLTLRGDAAATNWGGHVEPELVRHHRRARWTRPDALPPAAVVHALAGAYATARFGHYYYAKAQALARELRRRYETVLERFDVLALPTVPMKAPVGGASGTASAVSLAFDSARNTMPFDATGNPALSVPCGFSEGLPVGLMFVGRCFDDETVLRVGHAYENARGALVAPAMRRLEGRPTRA
ncbi:amidase family protein [Actinomadura gamaensis]|uniref:Amidase family protein n=1 Tax=Actinomadura gamaensis TaxID=1763541 RepID=A0ABV9TSZ5_9ACTN